MNVIWKYELDTLTSAQLRVPEKYQILSVSVYKNRIRLYVIVNPNNPEINLNVCMYPTGTEVYESKDSYVNSIQLKNGEVWHIFIS